MTQSENPVYQRIVKGGRVPTPSEALASGIFVAVLVFTCMALSLSSGSPSTIISLILFGVAALVGALIAPVMLVSSALLTARHMRGEDFALLKLTGLTGASILGAYQAGIRRRLATLFWIGALITPAAELGGVIGSRLLFVSRSVSVSNSFVLLLALWLLSVAVWPPVAGWLATGLGVALGSDTRHGAPTAVGAAAGLLAVEGVLLALTWFPLVNSATSIVFGFAPALVLITLVGMHKSAQAAAARRIDGAVEAL